MSILKFIVVLALLYPLSATTTLSIDKAPDTLPASQPFTLSGIVITADTGEPIAGAHVRLAGSDRLSVTGSDGSFSLAIDGQADRAVLKVTHVGFRPASVTLSSDELNEQPGITVRLVPVSETLAPVTVMAHRTMHTPAHSMSTDKPVLLPIDSGAFLREAGNASGIRRGGFGIDPVIRGMSGSRLNVRVDGLTTTAAACPNRMDPPTSHIRLSDIERVEIYRGPHALEYGPTFGGTVNFISHESPQFTDFGFLGDLRAGLESNTGHRKSDLRLQGGSSVFDFLLSGGLSSTGNYSSGDGFKVPAGFDSYDYGIEAGLYLAPSHRVTAGWSQSFVRDADFPALGMDMAIDDTYKLKAGYEWNPAQTALFRSITLDGYWSLVDHEMNNHRRDSFEMRDAVALAETESYGFKYRAKGLYDSGTYTFTGGVDHQNVMGTRYVEFKTGPNTGNQMTYNLWQDAVVTNYGFYGGLEHFAGDWTITAGARFDYNGADAGDPAPRFQGQDNESGHVNLSVSTGISRPIAQGMTAGLYLGRGVRSPDITERFINYLTIGRDGFEYAGNPGLNPEVNHQADLVFKTEHGSIHTETTLFISYITDHISAVIDPDMDPVGMGAPGVREFTNRGDALFSGFESSLQYRFADGWHVGLNGSFTFAEYRDDGTAVAEIPPFEAGVTVGGTLLNGRLVPEVHFRNVSPQTRYDEAFGENRTPGFRLLDANIGIGIMDGVTLATGVRNLFDEAYYEHLNRQYNPGVNPSGDALYEPGRRFFAELSIRF
jgi:iron complex outermembrane recepter protein